MSRFFAEATTYGDIIYVDLHGKTRVDLPGSIHDKIKCQTCRRPIGTFRGMHTQDDTLPVLCQRCEQKRKPKNLSKSAPVPTVPKDEIHVLVSTKPSSFTADMLTLDARVRAQRNAEAPSASGSEQVTTPEKKKTASPQKKHRRKSTTPEKFIRPISPTVTATPSSSGSQMATSQPTPSQSIADPIPEEPTLECEEILKFVSINMCLPMYIVAKLIICLFFTVSSIVTMM